MSSPEAVLFISFGGPEKREDIMPFLETVTKGRGIPHERLLDVAHHYEIIGGKSPINEITHRQAADLQNQLKALGSKLNVYVGNRNWHPFLEETLRQMEADGIKHAIGFVTAAYRCEASWERYLNAVEQARKRIGDKAPIIDYVEPWFEHPLFIKAICERIKEVSPSSPSPFSLKYGEGETQPSPYLRERAAKPGEGAPWVFTAHSIPLPMAKSSQYVQELTRTASLVAEKFGQKNWQLAYTSRSGAPSDPWLEPDVCNIIRAQAKNGTRHILAIPIGFLADHVEVLFDLDVEAHAVAKKAGVPFHRASTVGTHPLFIRMMAEVIHEKCSRGGRRDFGSGRRLANS